MDNRTIDIVTEGGLDVIRTALSLVWGAPASKRATHWKVMRLRREVKYYNLEGKPTHTHSERLVEDLQDGRTVLILLWHDENAQPLPYPLDLDQAAVFIEGWLKSPAAEYGREPDHDGDNERGWRMFTEDWGHVAGHHYAIVGVTGVWAMYGK